MSAPGLVAALLALHLAGGARAAPADALRPVVRDIYLRGVAMEEAGDLRAAAAAYRITFQQEPGWTQALLDEARVWEAAGRVDDALAALAKAPFDADVVEAEARLLLRAGRSSEAVAALQRLRPLRPEWPEVHLVLAEAWVGVDPRSAVDAYRRYLDLAGGGGAEAAAVGVRLTDALLQVGDDDEAARLAGELFDRHPDDPALAPLAELLRRREVQRQATALAEAAALPLSPAGVARLRDARARVFADDPEGAAERLRALTDDEPLAPVAWSTLSRVEESLGRVDAAVAAARRAEQLDPLDGALAARVGELLAGHYAGRLDVAAARAYQRAVQRRGSDPDLWFRKGELELRAGWVTAAESSLRRVVDLDPEGPHASAARRLLDDVARPLPAEPPPPPPSSGRPSAVPQEAWEAVHRAWAWQRRAATDSDALDRAEEELAIALAAAPDWPRAVNLDAAVRLDRGDERGALQRYQESLSLDPGQGPVWWTVGELAEGAGDDVLAREARARAAALGEPPAVLRLAEEQSARWRLWAAAETLARYRSLSVAEPQRAAVLEAGIRARRRALVGAGGGLAVVLVGIPWLSRRRRRAGVGLEELVARSPRRFPEIARGLAAIRHEVLKHHTTILEAVADALEDREPEAGVWAAERLGGPHGALRRLRTYVTELEQIGRESGIALNLRYRDPVFGPLLEAADTLEATLPVLARGQGGPELAPRLRDLSLVFNRVAYAQLGRALRTLCLLPVDGDLLREVWAAARGEFGPPGAAVRFALTVPDEAPRVRMFRGDLHDVLVNLLRNAIEATLDAEETEVGLIVAVDEDLVTGLERVALRVADRSPKKLTTARLRGRFLGRGLGLAVDLVTRAGGSVHVEPEPGWAKAVVVRIPRVEIRGEGTMEDT